MIYNGMAAPQNQTTTSGPQKSRRLWRSTAHNLRAHPFRSFLFAPDIEHEIQHVPKTCLIKAACSGPFFFRSQQRLFNTVFNTLLVSKATALRALSGEDVVRSNFTHNDNTIRESCYGSIKTSIKKSMVSGKS